MISLETRTQLQDLLTAYSFGYDELQWDLFRSVWTEDAELDSAGGLLSGRDEITSWARKRREQWQKQHVQTRHYQTNSLLTEVSNGLINGRTLLSVAHQHEDQPKPELAHTGVYADTYRLTDDGWKISRRHICIDHT
jgi:3-phenylpropionate/cinnamic acid dioxygenase small subunit